VNQQRKYLKNGKQLLFPPDIIQYNENNGPVLPKMDLQAIKHIIHVTAKTRLTKKTIVVMMK